MTPQEIAASGMLPRIPVHVTRMVQIGEAYVAHAGEVSALSKPFPRREAIFMHPVDWWSVFTDRTIWEAVVAVVGEDFDTKWERAAWREIGADR